MGGTLMVHSNLRPINEVAANLGVSVALVEKFIKKGLVVPILDDKAPKLTPYGMRRLRQVMELYEQSYPLEKIETLLNN
ncbi:MAG TPA: MerR family transcriptional regulator [Caldithrix abyssi]|uniref:MerR family transcriptional regulator n=1 Tax=Caldithrix abyssi TaxID=187145 RepID=A0A7V5UDM4_CALAY|nr:MerR family transcriptional regulator [Caldithrix abyssi]